MTAHTEESTPAEDAVTTFTHPSRRRFLTYLIAAPTVVAAARWADASTGGTDPQPISSGPMAPDLYDLNDMLFQKVAVPGICIA